MGNAVTRGERPSGSALHMGCQLLELLLERTNRSGVMPVAAVISAQSAPTASRLSDYFNLSFISPSCRAFLFEFFGVGQHVPSDIHRIPLHRLSTNACTTRRSWVAAR